MAKKNKKAEPQLSFRSLRAVESFACIGGDCENTCCQQWKVSLTKSDFVNWRRLARKHPAELKLFEKHVPIGGKFYAEIEFDKQSRYCPFHDKSGLCRVHSKLGEHALAGTCRTFPRNYTLEQHSLLANASLGCPEYLRLLLADDKSTDIIAGGMPVPGSNIMHLPSVGERWHWQRCMPEIAELGLAVLKHSRSSATLAERLFVVAMMMHKIDSLGDSAENPLSLTQLSQLVLPFLNSGDRGALIDEFRGMSIPGTNLDLQMIFSLFAYRCSLEWEDMEPLWDAMMASYKDVVAAEISFEAGAHFEIDVNAVAPMYRRRRKLLHARAGQLLMRWFERCFANQFFNGGASSGETPGAYFGRNLITVLIFDFAICSHQRIDHLLEGEGPLSEEEKDLLARHAVDIIHRLGRTILHVGTMNSAMASVLINQQSSALVLMTTLLKYLEIGSDTTGLGLSAGAAAVAR